MINMIDSCLINFLTSAESLRWRTRSYRFLFIVYHRSSSYLRILQAWNSKFYLSKNILFVNHLIIYLLPYVRSSYGLILENSLSSLVRPRSSNISGSNSDQTTQSTSTNSNNEPSSSTTDVRRRLRIAD